MEQAMIIDRDRHFMQFALRLARRGRGRTKQNPSVGALLVDPATNEIVGLARTFDGGRPHAETQAIAVAGKRAKGATLYVSLEPCSHQGQTPPCSSAIIDAGITRVVYGLVDQNPLVAGQGLKKLQSAGIETIEFNLDGRANQAHLAQTRMFSCGRPKVMLKIALSKDDRILVGDGTPRWVTGSIARNHGHLLRLEADAILIGAQTLRVDNPSLTCRLPGLLAFSPRPILLFGTKSAPLDADLLNRSIDHDGGAEPIGFAAKGIEGHKELVSKAIDLVEVAQVSDGRLDLGAILSHLHKVGLKSLLIEGGAQVGRSFLEAGLVDELHLYRSPDVLGASGKRVFCLEGEGDDGFAHYLAKLGFQLNDERVLGRDQWEQWMNL